MKLILFSIWCSCLDSNIQKVGYKEWGWITNKENIKPRWTTIPQASKACQELISCRCQKHCSSRYKCIKYGWNYTQRMWRRLLWKLEISCCVLMDTVIDCWKIHYILLYLTVVLFSCKCVFVIGIFQKNLSTDQADKIAKLKCTKYNFINWASLNQCKMSRNHKSFKRCYETMGQFMFMI